MPTLAPTVQQTRKKEQQPMLGGERNTQKRQEYMLKTDLPVNAPTVANLAQAYLPSCLSYSVAYVLVVGKLWEQTFISTILYRSN
jgi:hypothetical protein